MDKKEVTISEREKTAVKKIVEILNKSKKRELELLAYAVVCFRKGTNPFETTHLIKKNVRASECIDLTHEIADILEDELEMRACKIALRSGNGKLGKDLVAEAEQEFAETQL